MAIVVKDRVKVTTSTTGTGTLTLGSAETDFQAFSAVGDGNQTYYAIKSDAGWEVGIGTYTHSGTTLSRDTILESSNSGAAVSLTGTSTVFTTYPAERSTFSDQGLAKTFTADGSITAGKPTILKSNGKAEEIKETTTSGFGTKVDAIETGGNQFHRCATDNNGTTLVVYRGDSTYGYAVVLTYSGTTITAGTPVAFESSRSDYPTVSYDTVADKYLICWSQNSDTSLQGIVATVSGTSVSFGTKSEGDSDAQYSPVSSCWDEDADKHWVVWEDTSSNIDVVIASVSGTSITWGTTQNVGSGTAVQNASIIYHSGSSMGVIGWYQTDYSYHRFYYRAGTVSGTTVTFGSEVYHDGYIGGASILGMAYNSANTNVILAYKEYDDNNTIYSNVLTNSGTTLTVGTKSSSITRGDQLKLEPATSGKVVMTLNDYEESADTLYVGTTSASGVTFGSALEIDPDQRTEGDDTVFDSSQGTVIIVWQSGDDSDMDARGYQMPTTTTNFDANKYLGVASTSASDTEEVKINLPDGSINNSQTGLTVGEDYFTDTAGTVRTFVSGGSALSEGQYLGKALSTTALELKEQDRNLIYGKASASITKGKPVLVEADGDFIEVTGTSTTVSKVESGQQNITTSGANDIYNLASDGSGYVCAVWIGTSNYPYCAKGTVSATSITWGTPVAMYTDTHTCVSAYYDSTNECFIAWGMDGTTWNVGKITGSGNTATFTHIHGYGFGTNASHMSGSIYDTTSEMGCVFVGADTGKLGMLQSARVDTNGHRGTSTIVGSTASAPQYVSMAWDQANNVGCVWYRDSANSNYPTARAFTLNGTTTYGDAVMGTAVVLTSNGTDAFGGIASGSPDSSEFVCVWKESTTELSACTITLSGTTISNTTVGALDRDGSEEYYVEGENLLTYNPKTKKYYFSYNDSNDDLNVMVKVITHDAGALTSSTTKVIDGTAVSTYYWNILYTGGSASETEAGMVLIGKISSNYVGSAMYSPAYTSSTSNLTTENFIGFADITSSASATSKVRIIGLDVNQSGLTAGQKYYVTDNGTLSETAESGKVVEAGKSISATKLLVKG